MHMLALPCLLALCSSTDIRMVFFFLLKQIVRGEYIDYLLMQNCVASMKIATESIHWLWPWSDGRGHCRP